METSDSHPEFSVIITTEHEVESLVSLVRAVAEQADEVALEVIVADYAPESREYAIRALAVEGLPVRYFRMPGARPFEARNEAIRNSLGGVIVFTDDDCVPPAGWLRMYREAFSDPAIGIAGGPDKAPPMVRLFLRALDYALTSFAGTAGMRGGKSRTGEYYPRTWNMALRADAIRMTGYFDERLPGAQEFELALRMKDLGYRIAYLPDCQVVHRRDTGPLGYFLSGMRTSMGRALVSVFRPGNRRLAHCLPAAGAASCIGLAALSPFVPAAASLLAVAVGLYSGALAVLGIHAVVTLRTPVMLVAAPATLVIQHTAHAVGFIAGTLMGVTRRALNG